MYEVYTYLIVVVETALQASQGSAQQKQVRDVSFFHNYVTGVATQSCGSIRHIKASSSQFGCNNELRCIETHCTPKWSLLGSRTFSGSVLGNCVVGFTTSARMLSARSAWRVERRYEKQQIHLRSKDMRNSSDSVWGLILLQCLATWGSRM